MSSKATLRLYGQLSSHPALEWAWVNAQLKAAGTYWVVARTAAGHPHPRPVWGVWNQQRLFLSIGTPAILRALAADPVVTVHLDSGTEVVIVEGRASGSVDASEVIASYDRKYEWTYDVAAYGPLTLVIPTAVLAWRAGGWAGRESFQQTGRWQFDL
ncbi:MAG: pyridoxamine 5'-phosphate oxidase [bacterium]